MNNKIVIGVLISCCLTVSAYAKEKQQQAGQPITIDDIISKMKFQLQLTDQQADDVKPIIVDYLAKEKQLKLEEKKQLSKVLTSQQLYTWNFLQNEVPHEKKKKL